MPSVKTKRITVRFTPLQLAKLEEKSEAIGETAQDYIRRLVHEDLHGHKAYQERLMAHRVMANSAMLAALVKYHLGPDALKPINRTSSELSAVTFGPLPTRPFDYEVDEGTTSAIQTLHDLLSSV